MLLLPIMNLHSHKELTLETSTLFNMFDAKITCFTAQPDTCLWKKAIFPCVIRRTGIGKSRTLGGRPCNGLRYSFVGIYSDTKLSSARFCLSKPRKFGDLEVVSENQSRYNCENYLFRPSIARHRKFILDYRLAIEFSPSNQSKACSKVQIFWRYMDLCLCLKQEIPSWKKGTTRSLSVNQLSPRKFAKKIWCPALHLTSWRASVAVPRSG